MNTLHEDIDNQAGSVKEGIIEVVNQEVQNNQYSKELRWEDNDFNDSTNKNIRI